MALASCPVAVVLDGASLTIEDLSAVAERKELVELAPSARARMQRGRSVVDEVLRRDELVYGLTTGLAERKRTPVEAGDRGRFNRLLVQSHRVAQGPAVPAGLVRATMTCLANSLAKGTAGVRPDLAEMVIDSLNDGFVPAVRPLGSVGEADLGPMADLAAGLLAHTGFSISDGEGLAFVNNNAFSTAWSALSFREAERLLDTADIAAAMDLEAFGANFDALHDVVAELRPYPGIKKALSNLRAALAGSSQWQRASARNLQDPLTFRCVPQVHGASRDALGHARWTVQTELNSAQGNPAVVESEGRILSLGSFDALPLAAALDFARIALAPVLNSAAERTVKLLQSPLSGLPSGLAARDGTPDDALAEFAVASQAIAIEARSLAGPVSYELVSTSKAEGIEDRATMAPLSARRLAEMVALGSRVVAIELMVAAQALDLRPVAQPGHGTRRAHEKVRRMVPFTGAGQAPPDDLGPLVDAVRSGWFVPDMTGPADSPR